MRKPLTPASRRRITTQHHAAQRSTADTWLAWLCCVEALTVGVAVSVNKMPVGGRPRFVCVLLTAAAALPLLCREYKEEEEYEYKSKYGKKHGKKSHKKHNKKHDKYEK